MWVLIFVKGELGGDHAFRGLLQSAQHPLSLGKIQKIKVEAKLGSNMFDKGVFWTLRNFSLLFSSVLAPVGC